MTPRNVTLGLELIRRALAAGWTRKLDILRRTDGTPSYITVILNKRAGRFGDWAQIFVTIKHPDAGSDGRRSVRYRTQASYRPSQLVDGRWQACYELGRLRDIEEAHRLVTARKNSEISFDI